MREPSTFLKRKAVANDGSFALVGVCCKKDIPLSLVNVGTKQNAPHLREVRELRAATRRWRR